MSIVRIQHNRDNPYVQLNKKALEDKNISWASKGLWAYLMSRPDDWKVSVVHLSKIYSGKGGGEKAILALLNELIVNGYCERKQGKKDKGFFSNTEYIITEFKNKVPIPSERVAVEAVAVKVPPTKERVKLKKEEQQQAPKGAKVCDAAVAFYKCLEDEGLSALTDNQKKGLMKYSEEEVKQAVSFAIHPKTKIKTTMIKTIMWALKEKPEVPRVVDVHKNKKHAINAELVLESKSWMIGAGSEAILIYSKSPYNSSSHTIRYDQENFIESLDKVLKSCDFKKIKKQ